MVGNLPSALFQTTPLTPVCPSHKFSKRWQGPHQVTKRIDDHLYVVDLGSRDKLMNISKLKRYVTSNHSPSHLNVGAAEYNYKPAEFYDKLCTRLSSGRMVGHLPSALF